MVSCYLPYSTDSDVMTVTFFPHRIGIFQVMVYAEQKNAAQECVEW